MPGTKTNRHLAPTLFTLDLSVRFRDLDAMGHVNNAVFFTYFEEGRKAFFQQHFPSNKGLDFPFILAHAACDYQRPVTLRDTVRLLLWVGEIGNKRFDFIYRIVDQEDAGKVYASGKSVQVAFDYRNQRSTVIPEDVRERLAPYQRLSMQTTPPAQ
jgi:acyl-CoA thioester hydrolase